MSDQAQTASTATQPWLHTLTGSQVRIRTPGIDTDHRATVIEYVEPPNSSPPVFTRHEFIEVFCVIDGVLTFQFFDESQLNLVAGQSITCPRCKPHSFWNNTDKPVTVLLVCTPAGLDEFFIASNKLLDQIENGARHADTTTAAMKTLREKYGLEHVGKPPSPDVR